MPLACLTDAKSSSVLVSQDSALKTASLKLFCFVLSSERRSPKAEDLMEVILKNVLSDQQIIKFEQHTAPLL